MPSTYATALALPVWENSGLALPDDVEVRRSGDLAALVLKGSSKVLGFVPSRFNPEALPGLLARLRSQE